MLFCASFVHIVQAKLDQAITGNNEVKLMMKHCPCVGSNQQPSDQKSSTFNLWTTTPHQQTYKTGTILKTFLHL